MQIPLRRIDWRVDLQRGAREKHLRLFTELGAPFHTSSLRHTSILSSVKTSQVMSPIQERHVLLSSTIHSSMPTVLPSHYLPDSATSLQVKDSECPLTGWLTDSILQTTHSTG